MGTLVAVVRGTRAEEVIHVLEKIEPSKRNIVKEITLDLFFFDDDDCAHCVPQGSHYK